jgi:hypothetical protein
MGKTGTICGNGEDGLGDRFRAAVAGDSWRYGLIPSSDDDAPIPYAFPTWLSLDLDGNFGDWGEGHFWD